MSRGAVVYLVISLPATITKLNLSGCRETLRDEGCRSDSIGFLLLCVFML
jgi:hypothetical protein